MMAGEDFAGPVEAVANYVTTSTRREPHASHSGTCATSIFQLLAAFDAIIRCVFRLSDVHCWPTLVSPSTHTVVRIASSVRHYLCPLRPYPGLV